MAHHVHYAAGEGAPLMTADAFRVRLRQSGFGVRSERVDGDEIELTLDGVVLWLFIENGFVVEVEAEVTFVDDRKSSKLLELIESMGWGTVED